MPRFDFLNSMFVFVFHRVATGEDWRFIVYSNCGSVHSFVKYAANGTLRFLFLIITLQNPNERLISLSFNVIKSMIALKMDLSVSLTTAEPI